MYCCRKGFKDIFSEHNTINIRSFKNYNVDVFRTLLEDSDWSTVLNTECVNSALSNFQTILTGIIDKVAPRKTVRIKQRTEPWISSSIIDKIRLRDSISQLIKKGNHDVSFTDFASFRNAIQRDVKKAKANFFRNKLEENMGQPKKLWKHLKILDITPKQSQKPK